MVLIHWPIARSVEGRKAGCVFAELMTPKIAVGRTLRDPVLVHICQKVELAEWSEESADARPGVSRNRNSGRSPGGGVGRGYGVVLPALRLSGCIFEGSWVIRIL